MPQSDFETSMNSVESEEEKQTFKKWYKLDTNTEPTSYILRPITDHIPNINSEKWTDRQEAMNLWRTESRKIVETFKKILGQEQRDKYLSTGKFLLIYSDRWHHTHYIFHISFRRRNSQHSFGRFTTSEKMYLGTEKIYTSSSSGRRRKCSSRRKSSATSKRHRLEASR